MFLYRSNLLRLLFDLMKGEEVRLSSIDLLASPQVKIWFYTVRQSVRCGGVRESAILGGGEMRFAVLAFIVFSPLNSGANVRLGSCPRNLEAVDAFDSAQVRGRNRTTCKVT